MVRRKVRGSGEKKLINFFKWIFAFLFVDRTLQKFAQESVQTGSSSGGELASHVDSSTVRSGLAASPHDRLKQVLS